MITHAHTHKNLAINQWMYDSNLWFSDICFPSSHFNLQHCLAQPPVRRGDGPLALVLAPTRELAQQIEKEVTSPPFFFSFLLNRCTKVPSSHYLISFSFVFGVKITYTAFGHCFFCFLFNF